jgi:homoserine kinase
MEDAAAALDEASPVRVFGPASLSNLGPGFDTLGLCLGGVGDVVEAWKKETPGIQIVLGESGQRESIPLEPERNTAGVAAATVLAQLGEAQGVVLKITKGFTPGSGIGSSAACAVAAAWAVNSIFGSPLTKPDLIEAVLSGEAVASGSRHGDNVLPALLGGLVLVSSSDPTQFRQISVPNTLWISLVLPELKVLTRQARAMLPERVPLQSAVNQASALAFMIDAFRSADWPEVGRWMMQDRLAEPVRATLVPCYEPIKRAALDAGAYGCALSGSGPAMFAISDAQPTARSILDAMLEATRQERVNATGYLSQVNDRGADVYSDG